MLSAWKPLTEIQFRQRYILVSLVFHEGWAVQILRRLQKGCLFATVIYANWYQSPASYLITMPLFFAVVQHSKIFLTLDFSVQKNNKYML